MSRRVTLTLSMSSSNPVSTKNEASSNDIRMLPDNATRQEFENHQSLYLTDGNVILTASSATRPNSFTVFRVHQSLLSRHSSILKEMLADTDAREEHDGVPCIHMSDSEEELECLLKYIYGDLTLPLRRLTPSIVTTVSHLLKLSSKYSIPTIRKQLIPRLEQDWPPTLFHWDTLELEISGLLSLWSDDPLPSYFDDYLPEPASALRLGFECAVPSILPSAFYHLNRLGVFQDRARKREDPENLSRKSLEKRNADWNRLAASDLISLMKGQHHLKYTAKEMVFDEPRLCDLSTHYHTFLRGLTNTGRGRGESEKKKEKQLCAIDAQWEFWAQVKDDWEANSNDVLRYLNDRVNTVQTRSEICPSCRTDIQKALKHMRQEIWAKLPFYFDLAKRESLT